MQRASGISVYVIDPTYGRFTDDGEWQLYSHSFREGLEAEFNQKFEEENVGPGADIPAFVTIIPLDLWPFLGGALYLFFKGKEVTGNLDA